MTSPTTTLPAHRTWAAHIAQLDPHTQAQEIVRLMFFHEYPWDGLRALEFALFRTFAAPKVSALLDATGEFRHAPQRRYDDTAILIAEVMLHGPDHERGRRAIRRINQIHRRYAIANDEFLYVLSTFIFTPISWLDRFAWRRTLPQERQALYVFWRRVGELMNIQHIPPSAQEFAAWSQQYEQERFRFARENQRVGDATRALMLGWFLPPALQPLGRPFVHAMLDEPLRHALGYPQAPAWVRTLTRALLRLRARIVRHMPQRLTPTRIEDRCQRTYPDGVYELESLGAPEHPDLTPQWRRAPKDDLHGQEQE